MEDIPRRRKEEIKRNIKELKKFQEMFYADDRYSLLIILQARDAAGKDGVIRHVMSGINPQGCRVHSFKHHQERIGTRLFLASLYRFTPAWDDRDLQPFAL
jgi:polyphosphate kinase 2 (PPK2 family)